MRYLKKITLLFVWSIASLQPNAQPVFVQKLDSLSMLIGDQQHLTLITSDKQIGENPLMILDTTSWFHIIDKGSWIPKDQNFERKILFTVFPIIL